MQTSFYNTIGFIGNQLKEAEDSCNVQERRILGLMDKGKAYTPFQVQGLYEALFALVPVTSIRRALTNLTEKGLLKKCDEMVIEKYGKPNHKWERI